MRVAELFCLAAGVPDHYELHSQDRTPQGRQDTGGNHRPRPRAHRDALGFHKRRDVRLGATQCVWPHYSPECRRSLP